MNLNKSSPDDHKNTPQSFQSPFGDTNGQEQNHSAYGIPAQYVPPGNSTAPKTAPKGCAIGCLAVILIFVFIVIASIIGSSNDEDNIASENSSSASSQPVVSDESQPAKKPSEAEVNAAVDDIFVSSIREVDPIASLNDEQIVSVAKKVCQRLDSGETILDVVMDTTKLPKPLADDTARVAGGAVSYYCPEHKEAVQAYVDAVN